MKTPPRVEVETCTNCGATIEGEAALWDQNIVCPLCRESLEAAARPASPARNPVPPRPALVARTSTPHYLPLLIAAIALCVVGGLSMIWGVVDFVRAFDALAEASKPKRNQFDGVGEMMASGLLWWMGEIYLVAGMIIASLGLLLLAVRDIARNSYRAAQAR